MPYTIEEIGARVRERQPDIFGSFSDQEIGERVLQRKPELAKQVEIAQPSVEKQPTEPPQEGFLKSMAKEAGRSVIQTGARALTGSGVFRFMPSGFLPNLPGISPLKEKLPEKLATPVGDVLVKEAKDPFVEFGASVEDIANLWTGGISKVPQTALKTLLKTGGKGLTSYAKTFLKAGLTGAKETAKTGAVTGGLSLGGRALQEKKPPVEVAKQVGLGVAGGATLGLGLGFPLGGISGFLSPAVRTLRKSGIISEIADDYRQALNIGKSEINKIETKHGKDIDDLMVFLAEEKVIPVQNRQGQIETLHSADELKPRRQEVGSKLANALDNTNLRNDLDDIKTQVKSEIDRTEKNADIALQKKEDVDRLINAESTRLGRTKVTDRELHAIKSGMYEIGYDQNRATLSPTSRKIARVMKEIIENNNKGNLNVKQMNELYGRYSDAIDLLKSVNGKTVKGGKLGGWFAKFMGGFIVDRVFQGVPGLKQIAYPMGVFISKHYNEFLNDPQRITLEAIKKLKKTGLPNRAQQVLVDFEKAIEKIVKEKLSGRTQLKYLPPATPSTPRAPIALPERIGDAGRSGVLPQPNIPFAETNKPPTARPPLSLTGKRVDAVMKEIKRTQSLYGVITGIEPEKDENGRIIGIRFNPEKAAIGVGLMMGGSKLSKTKAFGGFKDLTTKFLEYAKGKTTLSKQEIMDFARRPELKKGEADLLLNKLKSMENPREGDYTSFVTKRGFDDLKKINSMNTGKHKLQLFHTTARLGDEGKRDMWFDATELGFANEIFDQQGDPGMIFGKYNVDFDNLLVVKDTPSAFRKIFGKDSKIYKEIENSDFSLSDNPDAIMSKYDRILTKEAKKLGYDGIFFKERGHGGTEVVLMNSKNAKLNEVIKEIDSEGNFLEEPKQPPKILTKLPAQEFADSLRRDLLELKPVKVKEPQYERVTIGSEEEARAELAGYENSDFLARKGRNYEEVVFESPISTNGSSHFPNSKNYFAHARGDEVVENGKKIWREQEIQSDLLQKDNLENLRLKPGSQERTTTGIIASEKIDQLQPFTNDRFGERIMRERIKDKAQKGYSKYRLPTGETIGKIEGFEAHNWHPTISGKWEDRLLETSDLKIGAEVMNGNRNLVSDRWIITDILGDGRFKAVPKNILEGVPGGYKIGDEGWNQAIEMAGETFDLTGKSNPQYRRYSDWGKFLKNKFGGKEVIDPQGNSWIEVDLNKEMGRLPIEAFGLAPLMFLPPKKKD